MHVNVPLPEEDVQRLEAGYALPRKQFDWLLFRRCSEIVRNAGGAVIQGADVKRFLLTRSELPVYRVELVVERVRCMIIIQIGPSAQRLFVPVAKTGKKCPWERNGEPIALLRRIQKLDWIRVVKEMPVI